MPKVKKKFWGGFFPEYELRRREIGFKCNLGWEGNLKYVLYSSLLPCTSWDPTSMFYASNPSRKSSNIYHGGIFNLEYAPDGRQLIAACEKRAIMVFDPLTRKCIHDIADAHSSCVNCIKFLDSRVFASCSDDKTVALWDVRNLKRKIVQLNGHTNWVKNIEYSSDDGLLVTSGFDGRILGWDINSYNENSLEYRELFCMQGLMRMRLTPDLSKLIICTTGGYLVVVHNLSLEHLKSDFQNFQPNMYRLMQLSNYPLPQPAHFTNLFYAKRNRVEFISDFPNDAELIHSLQVHPQGWSVLSRNTSTDNTSEWTSVHDVQDREEEDNDYKKDKRQKLSNVETFGNDSFHCSESTNSLLSLSLLNEDTREGISEQFTSRVEVALRSDEEGREDSDRGDEEGREDSDRGDEEVNVDIYYTADDTNPQLLLSRVFEVIERTDDRVQEEPQEDGESSSTSSSPPINENGRRRRFAFRSLHRRQSYNRRVLDRRLSPPRTNELPPPHRRNTFGIRTGLNNQRAILILRPDAYRRYQRAGKHEKIVQNVSRLTNYIEEPNKGRGFIKELCFSSDGRLICSPFDCGVRLLMFDEKCSELSHCVANTAQTLCAVSTNICHAGCVLSTKFSPVDLLLVSGCLNGTIVWHQPVL